jgi:hypothetical protein
MYQLNEIYLWNQHHHELLREAEGERLANQLRARRPKRDRGNGRQTSTLRRAAALWSRTSAPFFRA